jgi:hypothetical protein
MFILDLLGWISLILILLAYFLISFGKVTHSSNLYPILNMFGSMGLLVVTIQQKAWQSVFLNVFWILIAIFSLLRNSKNRNI